MTLSAVRSAVTCRALGAVTAAMLGLAAAPAVAQPSANDGYAADGSYRLQVELTPYLWLPATRSKFDLGPRGQISGGLNTGIPTASDIASHLHGAFLGYGLARYGPWSTELDIEWVGASVGKTASGPGGAAVHTSTSFSLVRVAPGFGYEVARGDVAGIPATLDLRTGFAWFHSSVTIGSLEFPQVASHDGVFVQPWLGTRAQIFPSPRWRIEVDALAQGFGVSGGSWGWGASFLVSYAVQDSVAITGGFRALRTERLEDNDRRTLRILAYGPILGITFRF